MINRYDKFVAKEVCQSIIEFVNTDGLNTLGALGKYSSDIRVAETIWIDKGNRLVRDVTQAVASVTGYPIENQEPPHVVKYEVGGEYKEHYDFFSVNDSKLEYVVKEGGQRVKTFLIYLNNNFTGGETEFPRLKLKMKAEVGLAIEWDNVTKKGSLNYESLHAGLPVVKGVKYILVIWIRENIISKTR